MKNINIALTAGGTGGHIIPALVLKDELIKHNITVEFYADDRFLNYGFEHSSDIHILKINRPSSKSIPAYLKFLSQIIFSTYKIILKFIKSPPTLVVGFGGYPTLPVLLAAKLLGIKIIIHEQNAIMGRLNRIFSKFATVIATSFQDTNNIPDAYRKKVFFTGVPVRSEILALNNLNYPLLDDDSKINLLVIGGSQGASIFTDLIPEILTFFPQELRAKIRLNQQCSSVKDMEILRHKYNHLGINAELSVFFKDMVHKLASAHIAISRAGASTIAELLMSATPSILIPLPSAKDNHQYYNAKNVEEMGAGWVFEQDKIKSKQLAKFLEKLLSDPETLYQKSLTAKKNAITIATASLTNMIIVEAKNTKII